MQKIKTPEIKKCYCGKDAKVRTWDEYDIVYRVECESNHSLTRYCKNGHRAICKWNNKIDKINTLNSKSNNEQNHE